jgi:hypothetical protein
MHKMNSILLGKAILTEDSLAIDGQIIELMDHIDFKAFVLNTQAQVATTLAIMFDDDSREMYLADDRQTLLFRPGEGAESQYIHLSLAYNGEPEIARILIGWCVQAYAMAKTKGSVGTCFGDTTAVSYIAKNAWRAAFISPTKAQAYRQALADWSTLSAEQQIIANLEGTAPRLQDPRSDVSCGVHPWPFSQSSITLFDLIEHNLAHDIIWTGKQLYAAFNAGDRDHIINAPLPDAQFTQPLKGKTGVDISNGDKKYRYRVHADEQSTVFRKLPLPLPMKF